VVANAKLRHLRADGSHDSGDLVTQYGRRRKDGVGGDRQVGVTEPRGSNLDENFAAGGRCDLDVLEFEPAADRAEQQCFHGLPRSVMMRGRRRLAARQELSRTSLRAFATSGECGHPLVPVSFSLTNEDMERARRGEKAICEGIDRRRVAELERLELDASHVLEGGCSFFARARGHDDPCAGRRQGSGGFEPQSRTSAGDDDRLSFQMDAANDLRGCRWGSKT